MVIAWVQTRERATNRTAEDGTLSPEIGEKVREHRSSDSEILRPEEHRELMAQCSILVLIASIIVFIAA
jgi:hypothetical protein